MSSFGVSLPVVALNQGFPGNISRIGPRIVRAAQVLSTSANGPKFGDPVVIIPNASGGGDTIMSVLDYITANGAAAFVGSSFAGVAVREVKTNLSFIALENIGSAQIGYYAP